MMMFVGISFTLREKFKEKSIHLLWSVLEYFIWEHFVHEYSAKED